MPTALPLWRGFNIVDLFSTSVRWKEHFPMDDGVLAESDFEMVRDLGFNFVRVPMSYLFFGKGPFARTPDETRLFLIDRVVEFGQKTGVHVMLAFHRAPGYCATSESQFDFPEKGNLFADDEERGDFVAWWRTLAERYRAVPADALSFDLVNEPINVDDDAIERTFVPAIEAITAVNPERLIHVEGPYRITAGGFECVPAPATISTLPNVVNSVHLYSPIGLTHFACPWAGDMPTDETPTWPYRAPEQVRAVSPDGDRLWDREALRETLKPYLDLAEAGHAVHVGELGAYSGLPHDVYLEYMRDVTGLLDEYGIGYAMWNFRGPFGLLDNGRTDARYEDFRGHDLDRGLLAVLQGER